MRTKAVLADSKLFGLDISAAEGRTAQEGEGTGSVFAALEGAGRTHTFPSPHTPLDPG